MKKFITVILVLTTVLTANAQSFQIMQSYNTNSDDFTSVGYTSTRLLVDYSWASEDGKWNVYTWDAFDTGINANLLLSAEREIGNSDFYGHLETRFNTYSANSVLTGDVQGGFGYYIPWENGASIELVPQYYGGYVVGIKDWANEFMFSINTSYDSKYIYYEGYYDSWYVHGFSCFTEQSIYYKISEKFNMGVCGVLVAGKPYDGGNGYCYIQPYLSLRFSL